VLLGLAGGKIDSPGTIALFLVLGMGIILCAVLLVRTEWGGMNTQSP
jgi:hypothetical protein